MGISLRVLMILSLTAAHGCKDDGDKPYPGGDTDTGTDTFTSTDADADTDTDSDMDTDIDAGADGGSDADADSDTDTGFEFGVGDCESDDDCPGGECIRIPDQPGGYWTCLFEPEDSVDEPSENPTEDLCTTSVDCGDMLACGCYLVLELNGIEYPHNECFCDECEEDFECSDGLCIPAGAFGQNRNTCHVAECETHGDCDSGGGGRCVPYYDACSILVVRPFAGKFCHYDDDPCIDDSNCDTGLCIPDYNNDNDGFICGTPECE